MRESGFRRFSKVAGWLAVSWAVSAGGIPAPAYGVDPVAASEPLETTLSNGLVVHLYSPELLAQEFLVFGGGGTLGLDLPGIGFHEVIPSPLDPAIENVEGESFFPLDPPTVLQALDGVALDLDGIRIDVFLLPLPLEDRPESFALPGAILLAPGSAPSTPELTALSAVHELGHIYHMDRLPRDDDPRWWSYRVLRGITDVRTFHSTASHQNQPIEIFAEDFRVLFGGPKAASIRIENGNLTDPRQVPGLTAFVAGLPLPEKGVSPGILGLGNFPNPFNPTTTITVRLDRRAVLSGAELEVDVYDVRGREVATLFRGRASSETMRISWDGRDRSGRPLSSGVYYSRVSLAGEARSSKMILIK